MLVVCVSLDCTCSLEMNMLVVCVSLDCTCSLQMNISHSVCNKT